MEALYFTHVYEGTEYEFKPNRTSQAEIDRLRKEISEKINPEINKKLPHLTLRLSDLQAEVEKKQKALEAAKTDKEKEKLADEIKPLLEEALEIQVEVKPIFDAIKTLDVYEAVMKILLKCAKKPDGTPKYDIDDEKFSRILDSIEAEYGLEQYMEICEAIADDVFTTSGEARTAEPPKKTSTFLQNRKSRRGN